MSEQIPTIVTVVHQCPDCTSVLTEQGILWSCPSPHLGATTGVEELAAKLGITFTRHEQAFDLDTSEDAEWRLNGTYRSIPAGIASAYGDLIRCQERINQLRQQSNS